MYFYLRTTLFLRLRDAMVNEGFSFYLYIREKVPHRNRKDLNYGDRCIRDLFEIELLNL